MGNRQGELASVVSKGGDHSRRTRKALYRAFGVEVESDLPLCELAAAGGGGTPAVQLEVRWGAALYLPDAEWRNQSLLSDGSVWLALARVGAELVLRFVGNADFVITAEGRRIICYPHPDTPPETIRHLFLDQVLPRLLAQGRRLVLHAGAVKFGAQAAAFLGESGQGKSTLITSLCQADESAVGDSATGELITDDCLLLTCVNSSLACVPSYPGVRLWPQSVAALFRDDPDVSPVAHYLNKHRVQAGASGLRFAAQTVPLRVLYLLEESATDEVTITPAAPAEIFQRLLASSFVLDTQDRARMRDEFQMLGTLTAGVRIARLAYPRDFAWLLQVRRAIARDLSAPVQPKFSPLNHQQSYVQHQ